MKIMGTVTAAEVKDGGLFLRLDGRPIRKEKDKGWKDDPINIVLVASDTNCRTYWLGRKISVTVNPL